MEQPTPRRGPNKQTNNSKPHAPLRLAAVLVVPRHDLDHVDVLPGVGHGPQLPDDLVDVGDLHRVEPEQRLPENRSQRVSLLFTK